MAVGLSMALAIAVCMGAFTYIYIQLEPWVQDFAGAEEAPPTRTPRPTAEPTDEAAEEESEDEPEPTNTPEPEQPAESESTDEEQPIEEQDEQDEDDEEQDDEEAFDPDYRLAGAGDVNFRTEPSTAGGGATIIRPISPGTELEYLNEEAPVDDPTDGTRWMRFQLEDGTEGWLREIDVEPI